MLLIIETRPSLFISGSDQTICDLAESGFCQEYRTARSFGIILQHLWSKIPKFQAALVLYCDLTESGFYQKSRCYDSAIS